MAQDNGNSALTAASTATVAMFDRPPGTICTFYSYKGGVGRSMTLANVAFLLSKYGKKVLIIDWDLEAPGLERYFSRNLRGSRRNRNGIVDLFDAMGSRGVAIDWRQGLLQASISGGERISILHAGLDDGHYLDRLRGIDWVASWVGGYLEQLRVEWQQEFDFILIDSRTGITDIGGICAIHLPDYLISMFTTTEQSLLGVKETMLRAREAHARLPLDRRKLLIIPLPSRDESNTEYKLAADWRRRFADELATFFDDWIPMDEEPERVLDILKIPYVAYWSFGEQLPVAKEDTTNSKTLAYSYALVARLLNGKLSWAEVREGRQTAIEESEQRARVELHAAEATRVREEAKAILQAQEQDRLRKEQAAREEERETVSKLVTQRMETLKNTALAAINNTTNNSLFLSVLAMVPVGAFTLLMVSPTLLLTDLTTIGVLQARVFSLALVAVFIALAAWAISKQQRARRILSDLERLHFSYRTNSGEFRELSFDDARALFIEKAETIAARLYGGGLKSASEEVVAPMNSLQPSPREISRLPENSHQSDVASQTSPDRSVGSWSLGQPIDVFISYAKEGVAELWLQEFTPIFTAWLTEAIGRSPNVYMGALAGTDSDNDPQVDRLMEAGALIRIVTPRYLRARQSQELLDVFLEDNARSPSIDIILSTEFESSTRPDEANEDFSDMAFVGEAFSRSERYIEFQQRVRSVAERIAAGLNAKFEPDGPNSTPKLEIQ
ncbi:AAA family ATPase [Rhizobium leguminosarum]|uniref:KGGVGR-motif variant AAA ATPase n=1 Tax=Rhizobium leguminosarum TaxID=384 RepID=UPI003F9BE522